MDINNLKEQVIVKEVLAWVSKLQPGIYELKKKYQVLKEIRIGGKPYKRGDYVNMHPSTFRDSLVQLAKDQSEFLATQEKLKIYMQHRSLILPDVHFSKDFNKIQIFPLPANVAQG